MFSFLNRRKKPAPLIPPAGYCAADIATQSSICTGETLIGFLERGTGKLLCAALVRTPEDITAYYRRYGFTQIK